MTRQFLLLAAAEPTGDPALLWRAAHRLGITADDAAPAEADGLLTVAAQIIFRHPLVRSAVYKSASPHQRRDVHRALAEATYPQRDPDRRAWHLAQAAPGPDEDIAAELQRSAGRAQARGGFAAAAAFIERSASLTLEPGQRAQRALAAAQATAQAGGFDAALRLLAMAEAGPLEELEHAQVDLLRARIAVASGRGNEAPWLLLKAAQCLEQLDIGLARETHLQALSAAMYPGRFATCDGLRKTAEAALAAPPGSEREGAHDPLLDGLALLITQGPSAAAPDLKRSVSAFRSEDISGEQWLRWPWQVCHAAQMLWDDESWDVLSTRWVELARDAGALGVLPIALSQRAGLHMYEGDFAAAASLIEEAAAVAEATGSELRPYARLALTAFRGQEHQIAELIDPGSGDLVRPGEGVGLTFIQWATALLYNGLARYEDALRAAQRASENPNELVFSLWAAVELIEAATRSGLPEQAADALERVSDSTQASGSDWALGIEARSRALLSDGKTAEHLYREALDRLSRTRIRWALARAHLLYGEWLRRENRRTDAREQLRTAHQMFAAMGADGFAERAARELLATGERVRKRTTHTTAQLTARETQIAQLAGHGLANPEIAAQLFISRRTVEYHLHKVFTKLAISTRGQLHIVLASRQIAAPQQTP
jgi:DNA-binding CsgD family transcriptional regulator